MRLMKLLLLTSLVAVPALAQNLMEERIWKISSRKKSIFLDTGVFHYNSNLKNSSITGVRSSVNAGFERVVVDFNSTTIPKLYGHISSQNRKLSVDFFDTGVMTSQPQLKNSKFVSGVDFINVDGKTVTMELSFKGKAGFDIFYLDNPGRLVIDIR